MWVFYVFISSLKKKKNPWSEENIYLNKLCNVKVPSSHAFCIVISLSLWGAWCRWTWWIKKDDQAVTTLWTFDISHVNHPQRGHKCRTFNYYVLIIEIDFIDILRIFYLQPRKMIFLWNANEYKHLCSRSILASPYNVWETAQNPQRSWNKL